MISISYSFSEEKVFLYELDHLCALVIYPLIFLVNYYLSLHKLITTDHLSLSTQELRNLLV